MLIADEDKMLSFGSTLGQWLQPGMVVFLHGNLGAGKTTLVRGILRGMGHKGLVKSPTYALVEGYDLAGRQFYHFDLYRLADPEELEYMGGRDYFDGKAIALIEWPEQAEGFLPQADLEITIAHREHGRDLTLKAGTPEGEGVKKSAEDYVSSR